MGSTGSATVGETIGDRYELLRMLGQGGMATVFLAQHTRTRRRVALKFVPQADPTMRERLLREARSMGRLSHPNVVGVLDMGEWGSSVYLVMEYIHGKNLREYVGGKRLAPAEAMPLLLPAASGVAAAHQAGILHRDLKPENLFICTDKAGVAFNTKVLDFGVAKHLGEGDEVVTLTDRGSIVGTPKYMAPEQIADDPVLDERTDVYALALITYEVLAGRLPYETTGMRNIVMEILRGELTPLHEVAPEVPRALSDVVMHALAPDAIDRIPSISEFARALEPWGGGTSFVPPRDVQAQALGHSEPPPPMADGAPASPVPTRQDAASGIAPLDELRDTTPVDSRDGPGIESGTGAAGSTRPARPSPVWWLLLLALAVVGVLMTWGGSHEQPVAAPAPQVKPVAAPEVAKPIEEAVEPTEDSDAVEVEAAPEPASEVPRAQPPAVDVAPEAVEPVGSQPARAAPSRAKSPRRAATKRRTEPAPTTTPEPVRTKTDNRDPWGE